MQSPDSTTWLNSFLIDFSPKTWTLKTKSTRVITPHHLFFGKGDNALEIAVASAKRIPKAAEIRSLWSSRQGRRPSPLLLVVGYPSDKHNELRFAVCGPTGDSPRIINELPIHQIENICTSALLESNRHNAVRFLTSMLPETEFELPGIRNSGLVALQELTNGVPTRADWEKATETGKELLELEGRSLIEGLGFRVDNLSSSASVLSVSKPETSTKTALKRAVAIFLEDNETFDETSGRFRDASAVSQALALADSEGLPWVVLARKKQVRLYPVSSDIGVGRKGRSETFIQIDVGLLPEKQAGYLPLIFGSKALIAGGTIESILEASANFASNLAVRLRDRIYNDTVPPLAKAVAKRLGDPTNLSDEDLSFAYEQTLIILFRLLFIAYGEDKDLLPYQSNSKYADHSLKRIVKRIDSDFQNETVNFDENAIDLWEDIRQLWRAVDKGNSGWGVPGYNGGLFSDNPETSKAGAAIATLDLTDIELGPVLHSMFIDTGSDGVTGPVDFRSLSVREFGTIYEGLLESMLSVAPSDLTADKDGNYVPVKKKSDSIVVPANTVHFHNRSGERKATGSYFTKPFAVEHLLDNALEPALESHLSEVKSLMDAGDEIGAAEKFFDFRCVDLSMGSGHFLIAAIDRIEARLSNFLAMNPIPLVNAELATLKRAALKALGSLSEGVDIENISLLRRQVARRCIYGVDINLIAVELARLAVWIHTFVPGLPLSYLDHSLVHGNSLTGIGTLDEAISILDPVKQTKDVDITYSHSSIYRGPVEDFINRASGHLKKLSNIVEATTADVEESQSLHNAAMQSIQPARQLFDLLLALRLKEIERLERIDEEGIAKHKDLEKAQAIAEGLNALHFPIIFPEVFIRENPGFDCILGNPPWEEVKFEVRDFLTQHFPGTRSLKGKALNDFSRKAFEDRPDLAKLCEKEEVRTNEIKRALMAGQYPGLETGDPDLYQAFAWRFWHLLRRDGAVGVVLPRSILNALGSSRWRIEVISKGTISDATVLLNTRGWVFDDAEHRYTIGLVAVRKGDHHIGDLSTQGPFSSLRELQSSKELEPASFTKEELLSWSENASFPLIRNEKEAHVFRKMQIHPKFDGSNCTQLNISSEANCWHFRPYSEFHATNDRKFFEFLDGEVSQNYWPVYKGESFNHWEPDSGTYYAFIEENVAKKELYRQQKSYIKKDGTVKPSSAFFGLPADQISNPEDLPSLSARVAFRGITNRTNTRTIIAALIPPKVAIQNSAPYLVRIKGKPRDEAYVLGILSSIPLDWLSRATVELNVNFYLINDFPIPRPEPENKIRQRLIELSGTLAAVDERYRDWAEEVGVPVGGLMGKAKDEAIYEIDACVAHLYGLDEEDLVTIFSTFHKGWEYQPRLERVLDHFRNLKALSES